MCLSTLTSSGRDDSIARLSSERGILLLVCCSQLHRVERRVSPSGLDIISWTRIFVCSDVSNVLSLVIFHSVETHRNSADFFQALYSGR